MIILGTNSIKDTGFDVANSLRFNRSSSDTLTKTFGSNGNNDKFTFSGWYKRSEVGVEHRIFSSHNTGSPAGYASMHFHTSDDLIIFNYDGSNSYQQLRTDRKFRDLSAFYHIVLAYDTTQGTASNRVKLYINGVQETSFSTADYPDQNTDLYFNNNVIHYISGGDPANGSNPYSGYMSEVCLVDNAQLAADSFGEFDSDSGIWKPIDVSGLTFGNTGFYLQFKESGTGTNASGMGADTSGNANHFTVNFQAIYQRIDTCTNNFATMNPLTNGSINYSEGNLKAVKASGDGTLRMWGSTLALSNGKFYWEIKNNASSTNHWYVGITDTDNVARDLASRYPGIDATSYGLRGSDGNKMNNDSGSSYGSSNSNNDIIMIALDLTNYKIYFGKNGSWFNSGNPANGTNPAFTGLTSGLMYMPTFAATGGGGEGWFVNFGSPGYSISSGNTDGNGYGNFEHAVPSGYFSLNTKNLAEYG